MGSGDVAHMLYQLLEKFNKVLLFHRGWRCRRLPFIVFVDLESDIVDKKKKALSDGEGTEESQVIWD